MMFILILFWGLSDPTWAGTDYREKYGISDLYTKIVDNLGKGEERLYGLRNVRMLFPSVFRGGANNAYHRSNPRENSNPLPLDGLKNLCLEGFEHAIYLYSTGFSSAPKQVQCQDQAGQPRQLNYHQWTPGRPGEELKILQLIHQQLLKPEGGLYLHCWNGWHASGYVSAISLIQFCGMSHSDAVLYWDRNTDGVNQSPGYEVIRQKIRNFKPVQNLQMDDDWKQKNCLQ